MTSKVYPKIAAHRGYKAKFAENTLAAFQGAVDVGVDCVETDIQVTQDGVCVINHDPQTGRVYNKDLTVAKTNVKELKELTNIEDGTQKMMTLVEFIEWFKSCLEKEGTKPFKIMLDIKANNNVTVLAKIVRCLLDVDDNLSYWYDKVIFGLWRLDFYEFGAETSLLKNFEIINITISPTIAKRFLDFSNTLPKSLQLGAISLLHHGLRTPEVKDLVELQMAPRGVKLYGWTLNTEKDFALAFKNNVEFFITDKPIEAMEAVEKYKNNEFEFPIETKPPLFSKAWLADQLRVFIYRSLEFLVLRDLMRFRIIQKTFMRVNRAIVPSPSAAPSKKDN